MTHRPIALSLDGFSTEIHFAQRIGIIGKNGGGKTSLLRAFVQLATPKTSLGYVPQIIEEFETLSGGQRFNKKLSAALAPNPEILCLDEPTNHLDLKNRRSLMRMLHNFRGTLLVVTHDVELLETCVDMLWHVEPGQVTTFAGSYREFVTRMQKQRQTLEHKLNVLETERRRAHDVLMRDQERAKKRRLHGEKKYDGDTIALRGAQGRGERTTNKNRKRIASVKDDVLTQLASLRLPEVITPKFSLSAAQLCTGKPVVMISDGSCGYDGPLLCSINLQLRYDGRLLLTGDNGSGKTTLVKAILGDKSVPRTGTWVAPSLSDIGYLDQHYATLAPESCALDTIGASAPHWKMIEIRDHLNSFLFRKNDEVMRPVKYLSGGERARLSLAQIAARTPKLLILDEVTNNLDLEAREHVIEVLRAYPGAMIVISHDVDFAARIGATDYLTLASIANTARSEPFTNFLPQVVDVVDEVTRP